MNTKTKALEALKTKFAGIDEKVLSRIAAKVAKTAKSEEEALEQVEDMTLQGVIDSYTDSRVSDASEKAVKSYEEKYGIKDGKVQKPETKVEKPGEGGEPDRSGDRAKGDDVPAWAKALIEGNNALKEELNALKAGKTADDRKAVVSKLLEHAPEKVKKATLREFGRSSFKDDEDFQSWIDEITPDIKDASEQETASRGAVGGPKGGAGGGSKVVNPLVQARIDARYAEKSTPAIQGLQS